MPIEALVCPRCGGRMVSRLNRATTSRFWGCANFPACCGTRDTDGEAPGTRPAPARDDPAQADGLPSDSLRRSDRRRWREPE